LISHRDILPTLTEYLGIDLPRNSARGRPYAEPAPSAVLTIAPSGRSGELTLPDHGIDVSLVFKPDSVTVTPNEVDHAAERRDDWQPALRAFLSAREH
jgi:hypothetical protein